MKVPVQYVNSSVLGSCPASVDMLTGIISINKDVWSQYDNFEKSFILFHEIGHYNLDTDSEYEADAYALKHVYKTAPRSLKRSLQTLCKIKILDSQRLNKLYEEALKLDASDGNMDAYLELIKINNNKITGKMKPSNAKETYMQPAQRNNRRTATVIRYADGGENKSHKTNGIKIGNWYFSFTNILLMLLILVVLIKMK